MIIIIVIFVFLTFFLSFFYKYKKKTENVVNLETNKQDEFGL